MRARSLAAALLAPVNSSLLQPEIDTAYSDCAAALRSSTLPTVYLLPPGLQQQQEAAGGHCPVRDRGWGTEAAPIRAVLVFNDPAGDAW